MIALAPFELVGRILVGAGKPAAVDTVAPREPSRNIALPLLVTLLLFSLPPTKPPPVITTGH